MAEYYTPKLSEFYIGFEYEQKYGDEWKSLVFDIDYEDSDWNELYHINYCLEYNSIRVKYLDENDLIDLGFIYISNEYETYTKTYIKDLGRLFIHLGYTRFMDYIIITISCSVNLNSTTTNVVHSIRIKNKSELVDLLKKLNLYE